MSAGRRNLWAPWRMEYIGGLADADADACFICSAIEHPERDAENFVLWRGPNSITLLNRFPYSSGHVLIAPVVHEGEPEKLSDATLLELMQRARDAKRVLAKALGAQGFNIGMNLGRCAGAGLPGHLHVHVVPRWGGDTNYMAVLSDTKVMPQALAATRSAFLETARELGLPGA